MAGSSIQKLLVVVLVAGAAWAGYWFIGAAAQERAWTDWFEDRRADGWVADYSALDVRGFPNRFDVTVEGLELADPETGLLWSAPFFQVFALSYQLDHLIAVWPKDMRLASPSERIDIANRDLRASLVVMPGSPLGLDRASLVGEGVAVQSDLGWSIEAETVRLAAEREAERPSVYRLGLAATEVRPTAEMRLRFDPGETLPRTLGRLSVDATVRFDKDWDRGAIDDARPQPKRLDLHLAEARWGGLRLAAAGELKIDARGVPDGEITLKARNWAEMLAMAEAAGQIPERLAGQIGDALALLSQLSGNKKTLDIPVTFRGGMMRIGPLPIGEAPRIRLR